MEQEASGSTPLFAVFLLSIYSIFLIPYTLIKLFGGDGEEGEVRSVVIKRGNLPLLRGVAGSGLRSSQPKPRTERRS